MRERNVLDTVSGVQVRLRHVGPGLRPGSSVCGAGVLRLDIHLPAGPLRPSSVPLLRAESGSVAHPVHVRHALALRLAQGALSGRNGDGEVFPGLVLRNLHVGAGLEGRSHGKAAGPGDEPRDPDRASGTRSDGPRSVSHQRGRERLRQLLQTQVARVSLIKVTGVSHFKKFEV